MLVAAITLPMSMTTTPQLHNWPLPMMPMRQADCLLPGESSRILLKESAHFALLNAAKKDQGGYFGQLLQSGNGRCNAIAPLLEFREVVPVDSSSAWAVVNCVGRLKVDQFDEDHTEEYDRAFVSTYMDEQNPPVVVGMDDWMEAPKEHERVQDTFLQSTHEACCQLASRIRELTSSEDAMACGECPSRALCQFSASGFHHSLSELMSSRRTVLLNDCEEPRSPLLRPALWGLIDAACAERQVLSFAACSCLSPGARLKALMFQDTRKRLAHAANELQERRLELSAELSLRAAFS